VTVGWNALLGEGRIVANQLEFNIGSRPAQPSDA